MSQPPRLAERLLLRLLPDGVLGTSVAGDLREEYHDLAQRAGASIANQWYWRTAITLAVRYRWIRFWSSAADKPISGWAHRKSIMSDSTQDIRHGIRRSVRSPGFSIVVILTLALGIGANTTIFSVVNSLLLRSLPYPDPGQLVTLNHVYPSVDLVAGVSAPGFRDYRDRTQSFENVAITRGWSANLTGVGEPVRVVGSRVSADYFTTYGITPTIGRSFLREEDTPGNEHVVVISDGFWKSRLAGDPDVLNSVVQLNDESYQVIGVLPAGFEDFFNREREFWVPIAYPPELFTDDYRNNENQQSIARMRPQMAVEAAAQEMTALAETIKTELPEAYPPGWTVRVRSLHEVARSGYRVALLVLLGAVGFVLLITCANVANLLLARGLGRQKEIAIRKALGASRPQLIRQLLAESFVLSLAGGLAGLLVASWGISAVIAIGPDVLSTTEIGVDGRVLWFTLVVSLVAGLLFGLAPALHSTGRDLQSTLREGGQSSRADRSGHTVRRLLIVGEFALALILLAGSGLMIKTISQLRQVDPGFNPTRILAARIQLPQVRYPDADSRAAFFDQLLSELEAQPGIRSAAITSVLPFDGNWSTSTFSVEGYVPDDNNPPPWGDIRIVSPGFHETLEVPLLEGRFFDLTDGPQSQPVVVVDDELARRFWPDQSPIGKRVTFWDPTDPNAQWMDVIGMVGHTLHAGLDDDVRIQLYVSTRQFGGTSAMLVLRTDTEPEAMVQTLRQTVFSVDASLPISGIRVMEELIADSIGNRQFLMTLLTLFSGLAILLASLGIYGIMSHMVRERSRELGLRMALGASRPSVFNLVLKNGLRLAGIGLLIGVGGAVGLTRVMQSQLFNVEAADPVTLVVVIGVLLGVAVLAICIPANRASRVDPISNLRSE